MWEKLCNRVLTALDLNQATLSGSSDIICVKQKPTEETMDQAAEDGWVYKSTPFHVRFGKAKLLKSKEKRVSVYVNGQLSGLVMKLGSAGQAYFKEGNDELDSLDPLTFSSRTDKDSSSGPPSYRYHEVNSKTESKLGSKFDFESALSPDNNSINTPNSIDTSAENGSSNLNNLTPVSNPSVGEDDKNAPFSTEYYRHYTHYPSSSPMLVPSKDNHQDSHTFLHNYHDGDLNIQFSLCGHLLTSNDHLLNENLFNANIVDFNRVNQDPRLWFHDSMVASFDGNPPYYPSRIALPLLASWMVYNKPLSLDSIEKLLRSTVHVSYRRYSGKKSIKQNFISRGKRIALRPTSQQLSALPLKYGQNKITFSVYSTLQGIKSVHASLYLLPSDAKIVISDIDGTITKSNALGHLMPIIGRDWTHTGVADLFTKIRQNGYFVVYLSARAIGQADITRDYLFGLTQNAREKLPKGPLFLSPDRLMTSIKREVITKDAYMFKIPCLRDIHSLFPFRHNPFYAGFGNNSSDHRAYVSVGVPENRVFIIDPSGNISHVNHELIKSYKCMSDISESMFPQVTSEQVDEDKELYNSKQFWNFPVLKSDGTV